MTAISPLFSLLYIYPYIGYRSLFQHGTVGNGACGFYAFLPAAFVIPPCDTPRQYAQKHLKS